MDLNRLALFVRVVDCGSLSKAAVLLKQPKSRVSRRMAALEQELGVALLYRTSRQSRPTEAGSELYEACRGHVYALEAAAAVSQESAEEPAGSLRLTATADVGATLLGPLIAELGQRHPKLTVDLQLDDSVVDLVKDGIDLALRIGVLKDSTLRVRPVGRVAFILVASPGYLAAAQKPRTLADLARHRTLAYGTGVDRQEWALRHASGRREKIPVKAHARSNQPRILLDLALAGSGVALVPDFLCVDALAEGRLVRVLKSYATESLPIQFVWPAQRRPSQKVRLFVDLGVERLRPYFTGG